MDLAIKIPFRQPETFVLSQPAVWRWVEKAAGSSQNPPYNSFFRRRVAFQATKTIMRDLLSSKSWQFPDLSKQSPFFIARRLPRRDKSRLAMTVMVFRQPEIGLMQSKSHLMNTHF